MPRGKPAETVPIKDNLRPPTVHTDNPNRTTSHFSDESVAPICLSKLVATLKAAESLEISVGRPLVGDIASFVGNTVSKMQCAIGITAVAPLFAHNSLTIN